VAGGVARGRATGHRHGEPHEATGSLLTWHQVGAWKRVLAAKACFEHAFPAPRFDSAASVIDYRVPTEQVTPLAQLDGSVIVGRTAGEVSVRCHDEQANFLAFNLMHGIVTGAKGVADARAYYAKEFLDARRKQPTPYRGSSTPSRHRRPRPACPLRSGPGAGRRRGRAAGIDQSARR
jgi:hypothetical protein